jgi:coenzyme F420-dependent glucose-6-phosphate dehydrogenase
MKIGIHASHEKWPPSELLGLVVRAQAAGFAAAMCSDHFHPWSESDGQSGFAWSWLGAAMQATRLTCGTVCAPGQRYHPAIIAQAAATLAEMFPDRFWLAVGTGEALNERITGEPWPDPAPRKQRLQEAVEVMRALWRGETVSHSGSFRVRNAKLYTLSHRPPPLIGAAITADTARWTGSWADGLITVGRNAEDLQTIIAAFHEGGGTGKPLFLQSAISLAATEEEAVHQAHKRWPHCALPPEQISNLATPWEFDAAVQRIQLEEVASRLRVSADIQQHIDWLLQDWELGFDAVYIHNVGSNTDYFLETFAAKVLPALNS